MYTRTIRIEYDEEPVAVMRRARIYLDDTDVSRFVRAIDIHMSVDSVTQVSLHCVGAVELPDDLQAIVEAKTEE